MFPLGALVFYKLGRHPLAGLAAGFAGAGAGFTANLFIAGTDVLLSGISTEAARLIDDTIVITPVDNWYFNIISTFMLTIIGGLITSRFIEPRLGKYKGESLEDENAEELPNAKKGLIAAVVTGVVYWGTIVAVILMPNSPLTNEWRYYSVTIHRRHRTDYTYLLYFNRCGIRYYNRKN